MDKFLAHILVVDDDEGIRSLVKKYLNENNFLVTTAKNAEDATEKIEIINFDMIILDIMMPGKSGLQFIKDNMNKILTPIILLTAKGTADERVEGLEIGADDYITKPFNMEELIARINAVLKRTSNKNENYYDDVQIGKFVFNPKMQLLKLGEDSVHLTTKEADLLKLLCKNQDEILERNHALKAVWGDDNATDEVDGAEPFTEVKLQLVNSNVLYDIILPEITYANNDIFSDFINDSIISYSDPSTFSFKRPIFLIDSSFINVSNLFVLTNCFVFLLSIYELCWSSLK